MSLTYYPFNDTCNDVDAFDHFFDDAFHPRASLQDRDAFMPRGVSKFDHTIEDYLTLLHTQDGRALRQGYE